MEKHILEYLLQKLNFLIEDYNFQLIKKEFDKEKFQFLEVLYKSSQMLIKIEKYRHEFYLRLASLTDPDDWADLFMIIEYINKDANKKVSSRYFRKEKDLEICYKKQLDWISQKLHEYIKSIIDIYDEKRYRNELTEINKFAQKRANDYFEKDTGYAD